jgi:hypothetical protein
MIGELRFWIILRVLQAVQQMTVLAPSNHLLLNPIENARR